MKKKGLLVGLLLAGSVFAVASCNKEKTPTTTTKGDDPAQTTKTDTPAQTTTIVVKPSTSSDADKPTTSTATPDVAEVVTVKVYTNPTGEAKEYTVTLSETNPVTGEKYGELELEDPKDDYRKFDGWYSDSEYQNKVNLEEGIEEGMSLYAKWDSGTQDTTFTIEAKDLAEQTLASDYKSGIFTVSSGTKVRKKEKTNAETSKSFTNAFSIAGSSNTITIEAPAAGTLKIFGLDSSSSSDAYINLLDSNGNKLEATTALSDKVTDKTQIGADGVTTSGTAAFYQTVEIPAAGTYTIVQGTGTVDVYELDYSCTVALSPISGVEVVNEGTVKYLEGATLDTSDLSLAVKYQNETTADLDKSKVSIDTTKVDMTKAGTYDVTINYVATENIYGEQVVNTYTTKYQVQVYQFDSIKLGMNATQKADNGYNGIYVNGSVQTVYLNGDKYKKDYLTVTAVGKNPDDESDTFEIEVTDTATSDAPATITSSADITYSYETNGVTKSASYKVEAAGDNPEVVENTIQIKVDDDFTCAPGTVNYGCNCFKSITAAMQFLHLYIDPENSQYKDYAINFQIAAGYYNEKVEFDLPNMTVVGAGAIKLAADTETVKNTYKFAEYKDKYTIIEWDSLYGVADESGYTQTTDSTATVAVRKEATNFTMEGITVSNWYNSMVNFNAANIHNEHRALAMIIQADKFTMTDCALYGFQDTIELMTGRQLITNTLITGTTDFIFGTNNTTLFKDCEIRSITGENTKGGYITAFKGVNKADTEVTYGAIFDGCQFTADYDVTEAKTTAIARPWGAYAKVAVINSTIGAHVSKAYNANLEVASVADETAFKAGTFYTKGEDDTYTKATTYDAETTYYSITGYTTVSQGQRYVEMSGNKPTASTASFVEYNNTGDGAITEADAEFIAGVKVISAEEAAKYADQKTIFEATNGKMKYADSWAGSFKADATVTIKNAAGETLGTIAEQISGTTVTEAQLKEIIEEKIPAGEKLEGYYQDQAFTTTYSFANELTVGENIIYVKFISASTLTAFTVTSDDSTVSSLTGSTTTNDVSWGTSGILTLNSSKQTFKISAKAKQITLADGTSYTTTNCLQFAGSNRTLTIDLSNYSGSATITIWGMTSKNSDLTRGYKITDSTNTKVGEATYSTADLTSNTFTLKCGDIYTLTSTAGINLYGVTIAPVTAA